MTSALALVLVLVGAQIDPDDPPPPLDELPAAPAAPTDPDDAPLPPTTTQERPRAVQLPDEGAEPLPAPDAIVLDEQQALLAGLATGLAVNCGSLALCMVPYIGTLGACAMFLVGGPVLSAFLLPWVGEKYAQRKGGGMWTAVALGAGNVASFAAAFLAGGTVGILVAQTTGDMDAAIPLGLVAGLTTFVVGSLASGVGAGWVWFLTSEPVSEPPPP